MKFNRADQVPNIFNEEDIDFGEGKGLQGLPDRGRIEMAFSSRIDLDHRDVLGGDLVCVDSRGHIPFDHANASPALQGLTRLKDQAGFPGSGRGHQIDREDTLVS